MGKDEYCKKLFNKYEELIAKEMLEARDKVHGSQVNIQNLSIEESDDLNEIREKLIGECLNELSREQISKLLEDSEVLDDSDMRDKIMSYLPINNK